MITAQRRKAEMENDFILIWFFLYILMRTGWWVLSASKPNEMALFSFIRFSYKTEER